MKRIVSIILVVAMLFSLVGVSSFAVDAEKLTQLADKLYWHQNSFKSNSTDGDVNENYFTYAPNTDVTPYVVYGHDVAGAASMSRVFTLEKEAGNTLIAGINGDYFTVSTGIPFGIEIKDGIIRSSAHSSLPEIGFKANGKAFIGRSNLNVRFTDLDSNIEFNNICFNKALTDTNGMVLFSSDFDANNHASGDTTNLIIDIVSGEATVNGTIRGVVVDIVPSTEAYTLSEGQLVLTMVTGRYADMTSKFEACSIGDEISVDFIMDSAWQDVTQALGAKEMLVESGSVKTFSDNTRAPRTAFGIKSNGSLVFYTCDGRDAGGSKGLTLTELARRMSQLGCTSAVNLDGGASTQVHVVKPGNFDKEQVNTDSGSGLRSCANYICFKNNLSPTGKVAKLYAYPESISVAAESSAAITIKACDTAWYPMTFAADDVKYTVSDDLGSVENNIFTAGLAEGEGTITASCQGFTATIDLKVKSDWPEINMSYYAGTIRAEIVDPLGEGIAEDDIRLTIDGEEYPFVYDGQYVTATLDMFDGYLHHVIVTAKNSKGHITKGSLGITLNEYYDEEGNGVVIDSDQAQVFADVKEGNWAKPYIEYLYRNNIVSGNEKNGKLYYNPSSKMTREEFAKVMVSWYGVDLDLYSDVELNYADVNKISAWAIPYVKAALSLGMMSGSTSNGKLVFNPKGSVTRQEVMAVIGRITESGYEKANLKKFSDNDKLASWAKEYAQILVKQGVISGSNGKLLPNNPVTRDQVAKIIFEIN
ncbi:MAG: phosphodiester glycosidase family protein [Bacillota bacterium]|nr:phosphodiester glycosidase family protein [Bacillota bacterium]